MWPDEQFSLELAEETGSRRRRVAEIKRQSYLNGRTELTHVEKMSKTKLTHRVQHTLTVVPALQLGESGSRSS